MFLGRLARIGAEIEIDLRQIDDHPVRVSQDKGFGFNALRQIERQPRGLGRRHEMDRIGLGEREELPVAQRRQAGAARDHQHVAAVPVDLQGAVWVGQPPVIAGFGLADDGGADHAAPDRPDVKLDGAVAVGGYRRGRTAWAGSHRARRRR